ncbi:lysine--tRNA ligase [Actinomycetes bacterium KLBMP 9797]
MTATLGRPATIIPLRNAPDPPARPSRRRHITTILAAALWVVALLCALAAVATALDLVRPPRPSPTPGNLAFAACAGVLAVATARRLRLAFWVLTAYLLLAMVAALVSGEGAVMAAGAGLAAVALLFVFAVRRELRVRRRWVGLPLAVGAFVVLAVAGVGAGYRLVSDYPGEVDSGRWAYVVEQVLGGLVIDPNRTGRAPGWVDLVLGGCGAVALLVPVLLLWWRARRAAPVRAQVDEQRLRALLARTGDRDSQAHFGTARDREVVFSATGKAAVAYRLVRGVSLAGGDPIGDPEAWGPAIDAWLGRAQEYGWTPGAAAASEDGAAAYSRAGLVARQYGDEAVLLSDQFTLEGRDMRSVRQAVAGLQRAGYTAQVRHYVDVSPEETEAVRKLATAWPGGHGPTLGWIGDPADARGVLVEARDADGARKGLLSLVPWGPRGLTLDLARVAPGADDGVADFLVASLMGDAARLGVDRVSLGVAVSADRYHAAARYQPLWRPRYVCAPAGRRSVVERALADRPLRLVAPKVTAETATLDSAVEPVVPEQSQVRLNKRERLLAAGVDPYPPAFARTDNTVALAIRYEGLAPDTRTGDEVAVAGRVVLMRDHGGVCFATLRDWTGDVQIMLDGEGVTDWRATVDIGDHVGVRGEMITSKRGELTVRADSWQITAKCLRPLPDKHHGIADPGTRARQRYLDLITSSQARDLLRARTAVTQMLRETLIDRGYLEVETPILQRVPGGARARPFATHAAAYDARLYLRLAPELYLKQLVVGGVERVFELGRAFRNEGADHVHSPEFTLLEAYQAYADYQTTRALAQHLVQRAAFAAYGSTVAYQTGPHGVPVEHDLSGDWPVRTVYEGLSDALGEWVAPDTDVSALRRMCDTAGVPYDTAWEPGALVEEMYERIVLPRTTTPTFYIDFPVESAPLARAHRKDPRLAERWDLVAFGVELGTGYSELVDPVEQRRRLAMGPAADPELSELDEDFLQALEYAMPPTGGLGLGVDRILMLLTGHAIRDTMPFPLHR